MKNKLLSLLLCSLLLTSGCGGNNEYTVSADGSTSMEKCVGSLGEAFHYETGLKFAFNPTGSGAGIRAVQEGRCDIGLSSRKLKEEELSSGLKETILAYDGIALVVHHDNPVSDLSIETISHIYTGAITNWAEIGGNDGQIVVIGREAGSGTREGFETVTGTADSCKYRQELTSTGDIMTTVSGNPNAIGYVSVASLKDNVKVLSVEGILPLEEHIQSGEYRLQRPFILVTSKSVESDQATKAFFDYITSNDAKEIIIGTGVVPANIQEEYDE